MLLFDLVIGIAGLLTLVECSGILGCLVLSRVYLRHGLNHSRGLLDCLGLCGTWLFLSFLIRIYLAHSQLDFALKGLSFLGCLLHLILAFEVLLIVFVALLYRKVRAVFITVLVESYQLPGRHLDLLVVIAVAAVF